MLDFATSATAEGQIQVARNKGERLSPGLVIDGSGNPTNDPESFYDPPEGAILPFGGHKGSGLSVFCEILAGSLTGAGASNPDNPTATRLVNNMLTIAFDASAFGSSFAADVASLTRWIRTGRPMEPDGEFLLPGEPERRTRRKREISGIPLDGETARQLAAVGLSLNVAAPEGLARMSTGTSHAR